ncbi:hypothetical protein HDV03_001832 [Kappamyces sp. JEL0829]|nr:hypothetical protein HDV03_001832 [Kappamyces sp. JEL0829]
MLSSNRTDKKIAVPVENVPEFASRMTQKEGNIPTSTDIAQALGEAKSAPTFQDVKAQLKSKTGRDIAQNLDELIGVGQELAEKDPNDDLTKMLLHAKKAMELSEQELSELAEGDDDSSISDSLSFAYSSLINLIKLMVSSGEFRGAFNGALSIGLDLIKFNALGPNEENDPETAGRLKTDRENMFAHSEGTSLGEMGEEAKQRAKEKGYTPEELKKSAKSAVKGAKQALHEGAGGSESPNDGQTSDAHDTAYKATRKVQNLVDEKAPTSKKQQSEYEKKAHGLLEKAEDKAGDLKERVQDAIPSREPQAVEKAGSPTLDKKNPLQHAQDVTAEAATIAGNNLAKVQVPKDLSDKSYELFRTKLNILRSRPEFRKAADDLIEGLSDFVQHIQRKAENVLTTAKEKAESAERQEAVYMVKVSGPVTEQTTVQATLPPTAKQPRRLSASEKEWKIAYHHGLALLSGSSAGDQLTSLIEEFQQFLTTVAKDDQITQWFRDWKQWTLKIFKEDGYIKSDRFTEDYRKLGKEFEDLTGGKHQKQVESLANRAQDFVKATTEDPTLQRAGDVANSLFTNLFLDTNGNFTIKRELLDDFSRIVPVLAEKVSKLPLPGIEYEDDEMYLKVDNIILESSGLVPTVFDISTNAHIDVNVPSIDGYFTLHLHHIQLSGHDMDFSYRKKTFPGISEVGKADLRIYDRGISADIQYRPWAREETQGIKLEKCDVNIDALDIKVHDTQNHSAFLHTLLRPRLRSVLKDEISKLLATTLESTLDPEGHQDLSRKGSTNIIVPESLVQPLHSSAEIEGHMAEGEKFMDKAPQAVKVVPISGELLAKAHKAGQEKSKGQSDKSHTGPTKSTPMVDSKSAPGVPITSLDPMKPTKQQQLHEYSSTPAVEFEK